MKRYKTKGQNRRSGTVAPLHRHASASPGTCVPIKPEMITNAWTQNTYKDAAKLVKHPMRRRVQALHVLLDSPNHPDECFVSSAKRNEGMATAVLF